jgi:hypothetical protein
VTQTGLPSWVTLLVALCGAWATFLTALALTSRTRMFRWLWSRLVADPVAAWLRGEVESAVAPIRAELTTNGGASLKDAAARMEATQEWMVDQLRSLLHEREGVE